MNLALKDRIALITGASEGRAIAAGFAENGATVVMGARRQDVLAKAAQEIRNKFESTVIDYCVDVERQGDIDSMVAFAVEKFGRVDVLIVNSGGPPAKGFSQIADSDWDKYLNLNLKSFITRRSFPT